MGVNDCSYIVVELSWQIGVATRMTKQSEFECGQIFNTR